MIILDGKSDVYRKTYFFLLNIKFATAVDVNKVRKQIKLSAHGYLNYHLIYVPRIELFKNRIKKRKKVYNILFLYCSLLYINEN